MYLKSTEISQFSLIICVKILLCNEAWLIHYHQRATYIEAKHHKHRKGLQDTNESFPLGYYSSKACFRLIVSCL